VGLLVTSHIEGIRPLLGFCERTPMNFGPCAISNFIVWHDRGPLPMNKGAPLIKTVADR
jgi:hypothetical protein